MEGFYANSAFPYQLIVVIWDCHSQLSLGVVMGDRPEHNFKLTCFCRAFCCAHKILFLTTLNTTIVSYHAVAHFKTLWDAQAHRSHLLTP